MGQIIRKQRVFVTSNERTVKNIGFNTIYELTRIQNDYLQHFMIKSESYMLLHGNM